MIDDRISGVRAFSQVQSLDPAEPRSADSPLAGQHQSSSYKSNLRMLSYVPYERVLVRNRGRSSEA